jgi:exonuclease SbcC
MKILQLRFKNLNSLAGEWTIDFTAPEYMDGIFAISGPTGAGKSTIMDAICLALYGRTPRLQGISKNSNEIMSRHTGECFAEVVFESEKGQFRCTWSQHRARRKPTEDLQNPAHEIADFQSGSIIESKIRTVAKAIEERTGMDFDRFTQSMLLAQGGFAAFLQANADERAPILEQITGTEIYSEISKLVYERRRTENSKLDLLKAETAGISILTSDDESLINNQITEIQKNETELITTQTALNNSILWIREMDKIKSELILIDKESTIHSGILKNFDPDRSVLQIALKASTLEGEYASLTAKRKLQSDELNFLETSQRKIPDLSNNLELAGNNHLEASKSLDLVKKDAENEQVRIKLVRDIDITIKQKKSTLIKSVAGHKATLSQKIEKIGEKKNLQGHQANSRTELEKIDNYLIANNIDALLVTELTGIQEKLNNLQEAKQYCTNFEKQLTETQKIHEKAIQQHKIQEVFFQNLETQLTDSRDKVKHIKEAIQILLGGRQLREYRADLNYLMKEMAFLTKITGLTTERKLLEDNKPCPLCGALHHPFALGNIPEQDETGRKIDELTSLINQADQLETGLKMVEEQEKRGAEEVAEAVKKLQLAQHYLETCQLAIDNNLSGQKLAFENYSNLLRKVSEILRPFGLTEIQNSNPESLSSGLINRLKNREDCQKKKSIIEEQINKWTSGIETISILIQTLGASLKVKLAEITDCRLELETLQNQRIQLYGMKDPDKEELRISELITSVLKAEREASDNKNKLSQELIGLNNRITELKESTSIRKVNLDNEEIAFKTALLAADFDDETIFTNSRVHRERREELSRQATELDLKEADLNSRRKDREERLKNEEAKKMTETPIEDLVEQYQVASNSLVFIREEIGAKRQKLADNVIARERYSQITLRVELQKSECKRWDSLNNLIGSADGKKYRNFAQGLTFEIMVAHANLQLMKLTDRYLLIRDKDQPLDLNVIDNYQAGEVRSTKNLSGGESFIVSLALALGLSKMASKKVRVDSLFLDEGFGTLDEDTLETALETLASLRQDGKLIGVISHVPALKERITTKILVQKVSGGKSIISGPGCSRNN